MKTQPCLTGQELAAFQRGDLASEKYEAAWNHLDECTACAIRFEGLSESGDDILRHLQVRLPSDILTEDSEIRELKAHANALHETGLIADVSTDTSPTQVGRKVTVATDDLVGQLLSPPEADDELGRLGAYRVLRVLGRGGMGLVFEAEDLTLKRSVALKVMLPDSGATRDTEERFLREAQALAAVQHDHVVTIYHVGRENDVPVIAMPLLEGESLKSRLERDGRLPANEVCRIACEAAEGLEAAHSAGLIHRDIKPDNIWLERGSDRVKLMDFGLAHTSEDPSGLTLSGYVVGTPSYLSPEQGRGEDVDSRSDLFSLGVVMYQMLTGNRPFDRKNVISTLRAIELDEPKPPAEVHDDIPIALSGLVMRLLEKKPSNRLPTCTEVIRTINESQSRPAVTQPAAGGLNGGLNGLRLSVTLFGGLVALVLLGGVVVIIKDKLGKTIATIDVAEGNTVEVRTGNGTVGESKPEELRISGNKPTETAAKKPALLPPVHPMALTAAPEKINGLKSWSLETRRHRSAVTDMAASHDGELLASAGYDGTIRIWQTSDFELLQVLYVDPPRARVRSIAWSRDGKHLAYMTDKQAVVVDTTSWERVLPDIDAPYDADAAAAALNTVRWSDSGLLMAGFGTGDDLLLGCIVSVQKERTRTLKTRQVSLDARWENDSDRLLSQKITDGSGVVAWDVRQDQEEVLTVRPRLPEGTSVSFSPDFSRYAINDTDKQQWYVRSSADNRELCTLPIPAAGLQGAILSWSLDSRYLAWPDLTNHRFLSVDTETGRETPGSGITAPFHHVRWLGLKREAVVFRLGGVADTENDKRAFRVVNIENGQTREASILHAAIRWNPHTARPGASYGLPMNDSIVWSPDGKRLLASASDDRNLTIWNTESGVTEASIPHNGRLRVHGWPEEKVIVGTKGYQESSTWTFDRNTGLAQESGVHGWRVGASSDGKQAVFVDAEDKKKLKVVDAVLGTVIREVLLSEPLPVSGDLSASLSGNGTLMAIMIRNEPVMKIWSLEDGTLQQTLDVHKILDENVGFELWFRCHFSPDNTRAVLRLRVGLEMVSLLWDLTEQKLVRKLDVSIPSHTVTEVCWIDEDRFVHAAHGDGVVLFDRDGQRLRRYGRAFADYEGLAVSPDRFFAEFSGCSLVGSVFASF